MTTATHCPTEPLRAEHRDLLPHLLRLETVASELDGLEHEAAARSLFDVLEFLRGHLVPHATAEEAILYPAVEEAMAAPGATATMRADHAEILARIDRLARAAAEIDGRWPDAGLARDVAFQLVGLAAILRLHFQKEEEVLLPILDERLDAGAATSLFARMGEVAHG